MMEVGLKANWSAKQRVIASLAIMLALVVGMGGVSYSNLLRIDNSWDSIRRDSMPGVYNSSQIMATLAASDDVTIKHILREGDAHQIIQETRIKKYNAYLKYLLARYKLSIYSEADAKLFHELEKACQAYMHYQSVVLKLSSDREYEYAIFMANGPLRESFNKSQQLAEEIAVFNKNNADRNGKNLVEGVIKSKLIIILSTSAAVVFALICTYFLFRAYQALSESESQLVQANQELKLLSQHDSLTGLANRRTLDDYLAKEWQRATREGIPLSFLMIDVDDFKRYNDTYGHQAGDRILKLVAELLKQRTARSSDLVGRFGGEEFSVVLPNTGLEGAVSVAELIRAQVEEQQIPHQTATTCHYLTVSIGVATQVPQRANTVSSLIEAADKALYQAKKTGRNRYCY